MQESPDRDDADRSEREQPLSPLRRAAASGVRWTSASTIATGVLQLVQLAVLAHLLTPAEMGIVGLLLVAMGVGTALGDFGFSSGMVARQTRDSGTLSTLYWSNAAFGLLIAVAISLLGPPAARFFDASELAGYAALVGVGLLINTAGQLSASLLQRDLLFARLAVSDALGAATGAVGTVVAAFGGAGPGSIAVGFIVGSLVRTVALLASHWRLWRPTAVFHRSRLPWYLSFGAYHTGGRLVGQLVANIDYVIVGRVLGTAVLGPYTVAYEVGVNPYQRLNPILTRVAFPVFAMRRANDRDLRSGFIELVRLIAFTTLPLLVGIAALSPELVPVLFGDGWGLATDLLPILAVVGAVRALTNPTGSILLAKQRPDLELKFSVLRLVATVVVLTAAATLGGVMTVAWSYAGLMIATYLLVQRLLLKRVIGLRLVPLLGAIAVPAAIAGLAAAVTHLARPLIEGIGGNLPVLCMLAVLYATVLAAQVFAFERPYVREIVRLIRSRAPVEAPRSLG